MFLKIPLNILKDILATENKGEMSKQYIRNYATKLLLTYHEEKTITNMIQK